MPDQVTRLRIFIASPSDVRREREILRNVVNQLNITLGESDNCVLDIVGWEDACPEVGELPVQEVINRQIPSVECDIFVGVMWGRFGTPTDEYDSGTEEEFRRAEKALREKGRPKILFYFCERPVTISTPEQVEQLGKVLAFKKSLSDSGLVGVYADCEKFAESVGPHLVRAVKDLLQNASRSPKPPPGPRQSVIPEEPRRFTVFVASVRDPLELARAEILEELSLRDIEVLRPSSTREATRALVARAHLCIHLLDGGFNSAVDEQLDMGCRNAQRQILWLSPRVELSPTDPDPYRQKLLALQDQEGNFDFMRCRDETREIIERVECLKEEWLKRNSRGIFFNIHGNDKRYAKELFQYLEGKENIEPLTNESDDLDEPTLREFEEKASRSRAVVVFYGSVSATWVRGRLREAIRVIYSKDCPVELLGVYVAPPPKDEVPIRLPVRFRPVWMDNTKGFDPTTLDEIISIF